MFLCVTPACSQRRQEELGLLLDAQLNGGAKVAGSKVVSEGQRCHTIPLLPYLSLLDVVCDKATGNSRVPFSTVAQGIESIFLPSASLLPSELRD